MRQVTERDYQRLLAVRTRLRQFERWSADRAAGVGLTASQHQLLLAIRGHAGAAGPTVGEAAEYLMVRHNTAVELVDRTEQLGLVSRHRDTGDHRVVRLGLTTEGRRKVAALAQVHLEELSRVASMMDAVMDDMRGVRTRGAAREG